MIRLLVSLVRRLLGSDEPDWDTPERRRMLIDYQRSTYYND